MRMEKTISITLTQGNSTGNTETIGQVFEYYKESHNEQTPQSEEQTARLQELETALDCFIRSGGPAGQASQDFYDNAIALARASEKSGFVLGFRMAMKIMHECFQ